MGIKILVYKKTHTLFGNKRHFISKSGRRGGNVNVLIVLINRINHTVYVLFPQILYAPVNLN